MWTKRTRRPGWRTAAVILLGALAFIAAACGGEEIVEKIVVQTVIVEKQVPGEKVVEKVVETVIVEKIIAGETVKVVETVIVEKAVTRIEKVVETVIVEKIVAGETVKVVETVIVDRPVTRIEKVVETVIVEKEVVVEKVVVATAVPVMMTADGSARTEVVGRFIVAEKLIPPPVLVPALAGGGLEFHYYNFGVMDYPLSIDAQDFVDLDLSIWTSWTVAPDQSKVSFTVRPGVMFHNGWGEMTAEDIAWSFNSAVREGSRFYGLTGMGWLDRVEATGSHTGEMYFKVFNPKWVEQLSNISTHNVWIASKKLFDEKGEVGGADTMIGTGPYSVISWAADETVRVVATGEHYRVQPKTLFMDVVAIPEPLALQAAFLTGEVDIAPIPNNLIKDTFAKLPGSTIERIGEVDTQMVHVGTGNYWKKTGPLSHRTDENAQFPRPAFAEALADPDKFPWIGNIDDPASMERAKKVRIALSMAVDNDAILKNVFDGFGVANSVFTGFKPSDAAWKDSWAKPAFDPAGAKALLAEAGFPNGFEMEFFAPTGVATISHEAGQAIAQFWTDIGIKVNIDAGTYASRRDRRFDGVDNIIRMHHIFTGKTDFDGKCDGLGVQNVYYGAEVPQEFIDICERNRTEPDKLKRLANNILLQDYLSEWRLFLPVSAKSSNYMVGPHIADWRPHTNTQPFFVAPWTVVVK